MFRKMTRRKFLKTAALGFLAVNTIWLLPDGKVFAASDCTVKTRYGTFNGFLDQNGVKTWLGIPYAKPPVGKLRWRAPEPLKPSDKTFDAKKFGFSAMQTIDEHEAASVNPQSEDCLTLNIWKHSEKKNLPVMVFIHGGGFQTGGTSDPLYNGSNFAAANDVVIVTLNYRVSVFGFVNFGAIDSAFEDSGYLGLKDQIAALQWIKENIADFGGNPDNITIFGESAGAISCMMLAVIPAAKGLFQKAIPQSGNTYMFNTPEYSTQIAALYMELGGAKTMGDMMKKSSAELIRIYEKVKEIRVAQTATDYLPTCDGKFMPGDPFRAVKDGAARGIKFLTGTTADEWRYWLSYMEDFFAHFRAEPKNLSPVLQKYNGTDMPLDIYRAWLKDRPDTEEAFIDFVNQLDWRVGQELAAEYQSDFGDVYYYLFSEQSQVGNLRSCHAIDLPFTFNHPDTLVPNPDPTLIRQVQTSWAAFAATGSPNNEFIPRWERYTRDNRQTMELNSKGCVCHKDLNTENLKELRYIYEG